MSLIRLQPRTWLKYPGTPLWGSLSQVPLWITVLALPCLLPPVLLHPRLELMQERRPAGSQQLVVMPNTQLEVGDKTAGGCISGWELILSSPHQRRSHYTDAARQTASKNLPGCPETEQTLCIPRQKPHQPAVMGPRRKGSAVGKAVASGMRTGCQEMFRGQGSKGAASSPQDAAQRFPRKFTEQKNDHRQEKQMTFGNIN